VAVGTQEPLKREKEHTRLGDEIAQLRRELPWVRVGKDYRFETATHANPTGLLDSRAEMVGRMPTYRTTLPDVIG
jgi:predicted dithiol-disulfide oxidoreductase (DUF899 family)